MDRTPLHGVADRSFQYPMLRLHKLERLNLERAVVQKQCKQLQQELQLMTQKKLQGEKQEQGQGPEKEQKLQELEQEVEHSWFRDTEKLDSMWKIEELLEKLNVEQEDMRRQWEQLKQDLQLLTQEKLQGENQEKGQEPEKKQKLLYELKDKLRMMELELEDVEWEVKNYKFLMQQGVLIAHTLVKAGANILAKDKKGEIPLQHALSQGYICLVNFFKLHLESRGEEIGDYSLSTKWYRQHGEGKVFKYSQSSELVKQASEEIAVKHSE